MYIHNKEDGTKEFMSSFGVPIVCKVEGGYSLEDVKKAWSKKVSSLDLAYLPSLAKALGVQSNHDKLS